MQAANSAPVEGVAPAGLGEEAGQFANDTQHVEEEVDIAAVVVHVDGEPAGHFVGPAAVYFLPPKVGTDLGTAQVLVVGPPPRRHARPVAALAVVPQAVPAAVLARNEEVVVALRGDGERGRVVWTGLPERDKGGCRAGSRIREYNPAVGNTPPARSGVVPCVGRASTARSSPGRGAHGGSPRISVSCLLRASYIIAFGQTIFASGSGTLLGLAPIVHDRQLGSSANGSGKMPPLRGKGRADVPQPPLRLAGCWPATHERRGDPASEISLGEPSTPSTTSTRGRA